MNVTSPSTTSAGFEKESSSQPISMSSPFCFDTGSSLDSPFSLPTAQPFGGAGFSFPPTDECPHPGNAWGPDNEELPYYPMEMQQDPLEMPMDLNTMSQDNTIEPCFDNGSNTAPPPRHRTAGQFFRSMTSSLPLPHKRSPTT
jgi:hypothetical protein